MEALELVVTEKRAVAADTVVLKMQRSDGGPLPDVEPGAHIALYLQGRVRRYSLLRAEIAPTQYEIGVLRASESQGGSRFIHESVAVADRLRLVGVGNDFRLHTGMTHALLIGGGIGITPLLSMATWLQTEGRTFELHHVVRDPTRRWEGMPSTPLVVHVGRIGLNIEQILTKQPIDGHVYVCGPAGLIDAVRTAASRLNWAAHRVHFENFGGPSSPTDMPLHVTLRQSGLEIDVAPGTSLLDALLAAGVWTGYECRRGVCGACLATVVHGEPIHRDSFSANVRANAMCTCVSWAEGPELVLDL